MAGSTISASSGSSTSSSGGGLGHSVVPIGGAPFVRPIQTMLQQSDFDAAKSTTHQHDEFDEDDSIYGRRRRSLAAASSGRAASTSSANGGMPPSPTSSQSSSPSSSFESPARPPTSPPSPSSYEAALRYSSSLHEHTRRMWEHERMIIERARLEAVAAEALQSHQQTLQKRSTLSGIDTFFRGRRRNVKSISSVSSSS